MNDLRARATDICMADAMPFNQHWEYRTTWPLADVLHDQFFMPLRSQFRPGDSITLCRFDGANAAHKHIRLLEVATVRVISAGADEKSVPLGVIGQVVVIGDPVDPVPQYTVERGQSGKHRIMQGDKLVQEFGSKQEADAELRKRVAA